MLDDAIDDPWKAIGPNQPQIVTPFHQYLGSKTLGHIKHRRFLQPRFLEIIPEQCRHMGSGFEDRNETKQLIFDFVDKVPLQVSTRSKCASMLVQKAPFVALAQQ